MVTVAIVLPKHFFPVQWPVLLVYPYIVRTIVMPTDIVCIKIVCTTFLHISVWDRIPVQYMYFVHDTGNLLLAEISFCKTNLYLVSLIGIFRAAVCFVIDVLVTICTV